MRGGQLRRGRARFDRPRYSTDGLIYFVQRPSDGAIKIGFTTNLGQRLATAATEQREPLRTLGVLRGTMRLEREIQEWFDAARTHGRRCHREWFRPVESLLWFVATFATATPSTFFA